MLHQIFNQSISSDSFSCSSSLGRVFCWSGVRPGIILIFTGSDLGSGLASGSGPGAGVVVVVSGVGVVGAGVGAGAGGVAGTCWLGGDAGGGCDSWSGSKVEGGCRS